MIYSCLALLLAVVLASSLLSILQRIGKCTLVHKHVYVSYKRKSIERFVYYSFAIQPHLIAYIALLVSQKSKLVPGSRSNVSAF